eukprot:gene31668-38272_t
MILFALLLAFFFTVYGEVVNTHTGFLSGNLNGDGLPAIQVRIQSPRSVHSDTIGNIYIADGSNSNIRLISAVSGNITTYAGNNAGTTIEGAVGTSIYVGSMWGITLDTAGRVYYSELTGCRVRVLAPGTRAVTTVAGTYGTCGYGGDGGLATSAQLRNPRGIYLETVSNVLYIADGGNHVIRAVNLATGIISTVAGNTTCGPSSSFTVATASRLCNPFDVWVSTSGNMYFPDRSNCLIRTVPAATGIIETIAGGTGNCGSSTYGVAATSTLIGTPNAISGDSLGNIYFQDSTFVKRVSPNGILTIVVGGGLAASGSNIPATAVRISTANGLEVDKDGNLLVSDTSTRVVWRVFAPASDTVTATALAGVVIPYSNAPATSVYLGTVYGLWANTAGTMYVGDLSNHYVYAVTGEGDFVSVFAGTGTCTYNGDNVAASSASLCSPWGLAGDSLANVYIADQGNCRVRRVTAATQIISTILGTTVCSCANPSFTGAASSLAICSPRALSIDSASNLYIFDDSYVIRRLALSTGIISTVAGNGTYGYNDGQLLSSMLLPVNGVWTNTAGNVFAADDSASVVRQVSFGTNLISPYAGNRSLGYGYSGENILATRSMITGASGVCGDTNGNVYIASNYRLMVVRPATKLMSTFVGNGGSAFGAEYVDIFKYWACSSGDKT